MGEKFSEPAGVAARLFSPCTMTTSSHAYAKLDSPDTNRATWFNPNEKGVGEYWSEDEVWRSPNAFRFQSKNRMFKYLSELHDGIRNGKRTHDEYWTYLDNLDLIEIVADQLDLPRHLWGLATQYYWTLHHKEIRGVRKDSTAVAVVAYTIEQNQVDRAFHPNVELEDGGRVADLLAEKFSLPTSMVLKRYGQVEWLLERMCVGAEPEGHDKRNMSRRGLYIEEDGDYSDLGREGRMEIDGGGGI